MKRKDNFQDSEGAMSSPPAKRKRQDRHKAKRRKKPAK
jgi:hypothetical protein